ncbi:MAG TPA: hypothetical protein VFK36_15060 [Gemmatimonadales bacterium]|nr:hypothetical protein [Gemmatimonadales bacterium]
MVSIFSFTHAGGGSSNSIRYTSTHFLLLPEAPFIGREARQQLQDLIAQADQLVTQERSGLALRLGFQMNKLAFDELEHALERMGRPVGLSILGLVPPAHLAPGLEINGSMMLPK